ncbi:MAG: hypothetical protein JWM31_1127 [Solirubrobacterales bacterium]|nr:hypothetical protein [Solirubrobacterales bacterium]
MREGRGEDRAPQSRTDPTKLTLRRAGRTRGGRYRQRALSPSDTPEPADSLLESLTDTSLYSIGAYFCDRHPDLMEDVVDQADQIERLGLQRWAQREEIGVDAAFQTLITGLAVRYFKAVAGGGA